MSSGVSRRTGRMDRLFDCLERTVGWLEAGVGEDDLVDGECATCGDPMLVPALELVDPMVIGPALYVCSACTDHHLEQVRHPGQRLQLSDPADPWSPAVWR